jgi:Tfp pilus assembly protein FimV
VAVVVAAVVAAGAVGLVVWAVLQAVGGPYGMAGSPSGASPAAAVTVEVAPGDTFWSIASRLRPGGDPRPLVDRLVAANGNRTLRVGEQLSVPSH